MPVGVLPVVLIREQASDGAEILSALSALRPAWLAFLSRRLPPHADAEDVLQEALLRVARSHSGPRDIANLRPWFFRILRNAVADAHARAPAPSVATDDVPSDEQSPWTCACDETLAGQLTDVDRELLRRVHLGDEPVAQVARDIGLTANAAYVRLHRARRELRGAIAELCGATTYAEARACACEAEGCAEG